MKRKKNVLFLCSSNLDRSPAAEALFKKSDKYEAKSAGLGPFARTKATNELINWADHILVMDEGNEKHKTILLKYFPDAIKKDIYILEISNNYCRNDQRLLDMLKIKIFYWLKDYCKEEAEGIRIKELVRKDWID